MVSTLISTLMSTMVSTLMSTIGGIVGSVVGSVVGSMVAIAIGTVGRGSVVSVVVSLLVSAGDAIVGSSADSSTIVESLLVHTMLTMGILVVRVLLTENMMSFLIPLQLQIPPKSAIRFHEINNNIAFTLYIRKRNRRSLIQLRCLDEQILVPKINFSVTII